MNLSIKDLRFLIEAVKSQLASYKGKELLSSQGVEVLTEDEESDLGNDIKYLECLLSDMRKTLEANTEYCITYLKYQH